MYITYAICGYTMMTTRTLTDKIDSQIAKQ